MVKRLIVLLAAASLILAAGCSGANAVESTPTVLAGTDYPAAIQPETDYPAAVQPELAVITPAASTDYPAPGVTPTTDTNPAVDGAATPGDDNGSAFPPVPGDESMNQGPFFVDSITLQPSADQPGYYDLSVVGSLPTPCNQPRVRVTPPDAENRIMVEAYSVADPDKMCTAVIEPFAGVIATLGGYPSGTYTVVLNENEVGEITVP